MKLSENEKRILESYKSTIVFLAEYMGEGYEFVLHSLENLESSAIKVINGYHSNREEGAPITDLALSMLSKIEENEEGSTLTYYTKNQKGESLRSITIPITGDQKRTIGLLCINFYLDTPLSNVINGFMPTSEQKKYVSETFASNIDDLIIYSLETAKVKVMNDTSISSVNKNKEIITLLNDEGLFSLKDAVSKVALSLGISKNTVYMHVRNSNKHI